MYLFVLCEQCELNERLDVLPTVQVADSTKYSLHNPEVAAVSIAEEGSLYMGRSQFATVLEWLGPC